MDYSEERGQVIPLEDLFPDWDVIRDRCAGYTLIEHDGKVRVWFPGTVGIFDVSMDGVDQVNQTIRLRLERIDVHEAGTYLIERERSSWVSLASDLSQSLEALRERVKPKRPMAVTHAEWHRLHDEEGLSYSEIAALEGVSKAAVTKAVQRERRRRARANVT